MPGYPEKPENQDLEKILRKYRDEGSTTQDIEVAANILFNNQDYLGALLCYQQIYDSEVSKLKEPSQKTLGVLLTILDKMYDDVPKDIEKIKEYTNCISDNITIENISEYLNEYLRKKQELDGLFKKYDVISCSEQNFCYPNGKPVTLADVMNHDSMKHFQNISQAYSDFLVAIAHSRFKQKETGDADRYVKVAKKLYPFNKTAADLEKEINAELENARQAAIDYQKQQK